MRAGATAQRRLATRWVAIGIAGSTLVAGVLGGGGSAAGQPTVPPTAPTASPAPPPPPPPSPPGPQAGTRVVATSVTQDGADLDLRVVVFESGVRGIDGGWSVTVAAAAGSRGEVTSDAVTITGEGGVPRSTAFTGSAERTATLFAVSGQQAEGSYAARYLAFGGVSFPDGRDGRPVVTVTLVQ